MNTTQIGRLGERYAAKFLKKNKYKVFAKNVHMSHNEIDIIAKNREYIIFVEVKTRSVGKDNGIEIGVPASAVTYEKQRRTIQAARAFLNQGKYQMLQPRFDVIEIYLDKTTCKPRYINHIINAFYA